MESVPPVSTPHREIVNEKLWIICQKVGKKEPIQTDSGCKRIREQSLRRQDELPNELNILMSAEKIGNITRAIHVTNHMSLKKLLSLLNVGRVKR